MNIGEKIHLDKFKPRPYQLPICDALENKGFKKIISIQPRRAGKDLLCWNLMIRAALRIVGVYFYIFPTYAQAKKVIWDSLTNDGTRFIDYIPSTLIESANSQEMKIRLTNGSLIQLIGSDNIDSIVGSNPRGVVYSEAALQDPRAYQFVRPILAANDGWCIFISTPRGKNWYYELFQIASHTPSWFAYKISLDDTHHIPMREIERERAEGIMSEDLIQQEYFCSFDLGVEGSYYSRYLDRMMVQNRIGDVPWVSEHKVHTAWDLGMRDSTTIIFFQTIGQTIRLIDCYESSGHGLDHYLKVLQQKPYVYGKHIAPHDIKVRELGTGMSRLEKARQMGLSFTVAPDLSIEDGIEAVRAATSKMWIDSVKCAPLIKALQNYRHEYDSKKKAYKGNALHDWSSHFCFTGDTLILTRNGMRPIMDIQEDEQVLTLYGWRTCGQAKSFRKNAALVEVLFTDGTKVRCTPDHLFLTENGWKSAEYLEKDTRIQSSLMSSRNILMDHSIDYGQEKTIFQKVEAGFIEMFGKMLMEIFQLEQIFITKIAIPGTTIFGILNRFHEQFIESCLGLIIRDLVKRQEMLQLCGIALKQEYYGIEDMLSDVQVGQSGEEKQKNASIVLKNFLRFYERMDININSATPIAKPLFIESVKWLKVREDVWCINVPDVKHFSLSNGAIVHNSDCARYLAISLPKTRDGATPEDIDRNYREAMGGNQSHLPSVFRTDLPDY